MERFIIDSNDTIKGTEIISLCSYITLIEKLTDLDYLSFAISLQEEAETIDQQCHVLKEAPGTRRLLVGVESVSMIRVMGMIIIVMSMIMVMSMIRVMSMMRQ